MAHSDLGIRILIIGVTRDMVQTQTRTLNLVEDLGAGAGLTTAQMYDVLRVASKTVDKDKADVITTKKLDILLISTLRKWKMTGDRQDTIPWVKEHLSLKTRRSKNGMMIM